MTHWYDSSGNWRFMFEDICGDYDKVARLENNPMMSDIHKLIDMKQKRSFLSALGILLWLIMTQLLIIMTHYDSTWFRILVWFIIWPENANIPKDDEFALPDDLASFLTNSNPFTMG